MIEIMNYIFFVQWHSKYYRTTHNTQIISKIFSYKRIPTILLATVKIPQVELSKNATVLHATIPHKRRNGGSKGYHTNVIKRSYYRTNIKL